MLERHAPSRPARASVEGMNRGFEVARTVLIVEPLPGIGDLVWHLPAIQALRRRHPNAQVTLATMRRTRALDLLAGTPRLDCFWLDRSDGSRLDLGALAGAWRVRAFDLAYVLHRSWRYAAAARLARVPLRLGYGETRGQRLFLSGKPYLDPAGRRRPATERAADFMARLGFDDFDPVPRFDVTAAESAHARAEIAVLGAAPAALLLGASEPFKQWGAAAFLALARILPAHGVSGVLIVGGTLERGLVDQVAAHLPAHLPVLRAIDRPLRALAALLAECRVAIGNDTGALNLAVAAGTRSLGLFGATRPLAYAPHLVAVTPTDRIGGMAAIRPEDVLPHLPAMA